MAVYIDKHRVVRRAPKQVIDDALASLYREATHQGFSGATYVFWGRETQYLETELRAPVLGIHYGSSVAPWETWMGEYLNAVHHKEPVYKACMQTTLPVWWGVDAGHEPTAGARVHYDTHDVDQFSRCHHYTGVRNGIAVPIRGKQGGFGYISFMMDDQITHDQWRRLEDGSELLSLGYSFYESLAEYLDPEDRIEKPLSMRERQCLGLAARGYTLDETAEKLCISRSTVRYHLENSIIKLDVDKRIQAISKALSLGLLGPCYHS
jgi:DNA-binding CsgD family transcriptional regulator